MKRTFLIVLSLCAMLIGKAQERPVLDLSNNNCRFEVGYNKVKTICTGARSIEQLHDLYNMDVCSYYNLTQYDTELKRKTFANSEDGKTLLETMKNIKTNLNAMKHYYIFPFSANMGWDKAYNLKTKTFDFGYVVDETGFLPVSGIINQEDKLKKSFDYTLPGNSETDKGQSLTVFSSESSLLVPKDTTNLNIEQQFMDEIIEKAKKSSPIGTEKTWGSKVYINAGIG